MPRDSGEPINSRPSRGPDQTDEPVDPNQKTRKFSAIDPPQAPQKPDEAPTQVPDADLPESSASVVINVPASTKPNPDIPAQL